MQKKLKIKTIAYVSFSFISIMLLIFNIIFFELLRSQINRSLDISSLTLKFSIPVAIIYIFFFIFHAAAIISIFIELRFFKRDNFFRAFVFYLSFISSMMLFGDFALTGDITKEYGAKLLNGINMEFMILYFSQALHLIFIILFIVLSFYSLKTASKDYFSKETLKDEAIFINAQYIGIFSGVFGLTILFFTIATTPLWAMRKGIFFLCIFSLIPYLIIVIYWLILKIKERQNEFCDEKQYHDICKSALYSIIVSTLFSAAAFLIQNINSKATEYISVVWFPFYLFFTILMFSFLTLYFNKKA